MINNEFGFNDAVSKLMAGKSLGGTNGILAPLAKQRVKDALEAEIDSHLGEERLK